MSSATTSNRIISSTPVRESIKLSSQSMVNIRHYSLSFSLELIILHNMCFASHMLISFIVFIFYSTRKQTALKLGNQNQNARVVQIGGDSSQTNHSKSHILNNSHTIKKESYVFVGINLFRKQKDTKFIESAL